MPQIKDLSKVLYPELSYKVYGLCFKVHNELGRFRNEKQYADALEHAFRDSKIIYEREIPLAISFAGEKTRKNIKYLKHLPHQHETSSTLFFVEGFFDAEGCVKIIKEKVRHLPKICLDITNTNLQYLDFIKKMLKKCLKIEARYSIQKPIGNRKIAYHLRIYKKEYVRKFFENTKTTKLKKEKITYVKNWLNLEDNTSLLASN